MTYTHIIGVDEAGRGPLAGPVAVGAVIVASGFDIRTAFPGVNDSKKLSEKKRETIYREMEERMRLGDVFFCVHFSEASTIDEIGITRAVHKGVYAGIRALAPEPKGIKVLLDGLLHAPEEYEQETIIKGDALEPVISLASIAAKVERDRLMQALALQYPGYGFEAHKGYGTRAHYKAIEERGVSGIHRRSFL